MVDSYEKLDNVRTGLAGQVPLSAVTYKLIDLVKD